MRLLVYSAYYTMSLIQMSVRVMILVINIHAGLEAYKQYIHTSMHAYRHTHSGRMF